MYNGLSHITEINEMTMALKNGLIKKKARMIRTRKVISKKQPVG